MLFTKMLKHVIHTGSLSAIDANGAIHRFGEASSEHPGLIVRLHDRKLHHSLFLNTQMAAGEAYMNGTLTVENGDIYDLLALIGQNVNVADWHPFNKWTRACSRLLRRFNQYNPLGKSRENVAHHYDLSGQLYNLFLDSDLQYSCAYFKNPTDDLEAAQQNKKRLIERKLLLEPGMRILDIGSGWGGLSLHLAQAAEDIRVDGLTLSEEQLKVSRAKARRAGLDDRVQFHLRDYREHIGQYDRIVSVGMFEHVGVTHYPAYFSKVNDLLDKDGVALLHTIGRSDGPGHTDPWIRKYIFPGGYCPALSEIVRVTEKSGLIATDIEVLRLHYAHTLRHWRQRFMSNRQKLLELFDEPFCRMWEFYLAASEMSFRHLNSVVFQIQLAKRQEAVPQTRDYLFSNPPKNSRNLRAA